MKNKLSKIVIIFLLLLGFGTWFYFDTLNSPNNAIVIDNPTNETISVIIDSKNYTIDKNNFHPIILEKGTHKISCTTSNINNEFFEIKDIPYGVINPTKSKYIIYPIVYAESDEIKKDFKPYMIEGKEIYAYGGEPKVTTSLFIEDYTMGNEGNICNEIPTTKSWNRISTQENAILLRIFRLNDFFEFYDKNNK